MIPIDTQIDLRNRHLFSFRSAKLTQADHVRHTQANERSIRRQTLFATVRHFQMTAQRTGRSGDGGLLLCLEQLVGLND